MPQPRPITPRLHNESITHTSDTRPLRVVQQDAWEQPWGTTPPPAEAARNVGDRVIVRQGRQPIPDLLGQVGTILEVFRVPRDSCLVRFDNDPEHQREWFFYHDEVASSAE